MNTTVEISFYPFKETYRDAIQEFVLKVNEFQDLVISTGPTSTVTTGEHDHLFTSLNQMMKWSYATYGKSVFIAKILLDSNP